MNRTSPIWKLSTEEFILRCNSHTSLANIIRSFGLQADAGNYVTLKRRIQTESVNISHIKTGLNSNQGRRFIRKYDRESLLKALNEGKLTDNSSVRNQIIKWELLPYRKCAICGLENEWNGKPISFQLDHIDGNTKNHHITNLRFICPNCHSQTGTFSGKKTKRIGIP